MNLSFEQIAKAIKCPAGNVESDWPRIEQGLASFAGYSDKVAIAALATIAVETAHTFKPIHEIGSKAYFIKHYWENEHVRKMLGNITPEDAWKYAGAGYIQESGLDNYKSDGAAIGVDIVDDPDKASDPIVSCALFVNYFVKHHVYDAANAGAWSRVRQLVNGGFNGLQDFMSCVNALEALLA